MTIRNPATPPAQYTLLLIGVRIHQPHGLEILKHGRSQLGILIVNPDIDPGSGYSCIKMLQFAV